MFPYTNWGFKNSPFDTNPLPASEIGEILLVGRTKELRSVEGFLQSPPKSISIEGANGIGKTSLVNVASFTLQRKYRQGEISGLFVPCLSRFQLKPGQSTTEIIDNVLREVAQTLIFYAKEFDGRLWDRKSSVIDKWLNNPFLKGVSAGAFGITGGIESQAGTEGFNKSGFRKFVTDWLKHIFELPSSGGVICILDNLELLKSSKEAKDQLEQLRDELITIPGLRWVLCGSSGITLGLASSPRMQGYLFQPINLGNIKGATAKEIFDSRILAARSSEEIFMPLSSENFSEIYDIFQGNLRHTLNMADDFCQWINQEGHNLSGYDSQHFGNWLVSQGQEAFLAANNYLNLGALAVFDKAVEIGGSFSPGEYELFGFNTDQALQYHVKSFVRAELLQSSLDEDDRRRKTIQITSRGHLFWYHRSLTKL